MIRPVVHLRFSLTIATVSLHSRPHPPLRSFGKIARSFHLPPYADLQSVKARVENGVLTIEVGKKPEEKVEPAGIDIQVE